MKQYFIVFCLFICILSGSESYGHLNSMNDRVRIQIGSSTFYATLFDNATAAAFKSRLPMTVNMSELNGNEKYYFLSGNLPTDAVNIGNINTGDLMLWGSNCLVLFYKTFPTSYSYSKLGRIEDTAGFAAAVGYGSISVTFESASATGIGLYDVPGSFVLKQNYPNPFNPFTTISYTIPAIITGDHLPLQLKVYNILGKEVATLVNENQAAGNYEVKFDGSNLSSGTYFYKIRAGNYNDTKKLIILK